MKHLVFAFAIVFLFSCKQDDATYALIETDFGNMKVELYNSTPQHKENFIKLVKDGFYDDLLFHRIISGFMIQGGDPDSRGADLSRQLGGGGPGYQIPAEIGAPHFKGVLAAARNNNPEKKSSGSQFYVVQGSPVSDQTLTSQAIRKGLTYNQAQIDKYKAVGGAPHLDGDYTAFGEVVEGLDVIDKIAAVQTGESDRPIEDVKMKITIL